MDSTGGTNRHGYTLTQLYASTEQGFGVPLAMQVADTETIESFVHFLEQVRAASGPAFAPSCFIIDKGALWYSLVRALLRARAFARTFSDLFI